MTDPFSALMSAAAAPLAGGSAVASALANTAAKGAVGTAGAASAVNPGQTTMGDAMATAAAIAAGDFMKGVAVSLLFCMITSCAQIG